MKMNRRRASILTAAFAFVGGVLTASLVFLARDGARRESPPQPAAAGKDAAAPRAAPSPAIDFVFHKGQTNAEIPIEIRAPLAVRACQRVYLDGEWGVVIDRVVIDGQEIAPVVVDGILDDFVDWSIPNPGASFRYDFTITRLETLDNHREHYVGRRFPVDKEPSRSIEIAYRVRCAEHEGNFSEELVTRGILFVPPSSHARQSVPEDARR